MASLDTSIPSIFDRILEGEIPCKKVYEDEFVLAFQDIQPQAPIHVLVIPKKKAFWFSAMVEWSDVEVGQYFRSAAKVVKQLGLDEDGYRLVINEGRFGKQTVPYIHIHLVGGRELEWPPG
jgi:histidine triad (HIT) family protein